MIDLWCEVHAQTYHNAADLASGHYDVALTDYGRAHAQSVMRGRYADQPFDVVFTSDTQRAYDTACLMFADRAIPILQDARLRECDYGDFEGRPRVEMERMRLSAICTPFPNGESYAQVAARMRHFLMQLAAERDGQRVMLVGHGATLWTLEHWLQGKSLAAVIGKFPERPWRFALDPQQLAAGVVGN
jgi:broad specificity phosphatase PhoE